MGVGVVKQFTGRLLPLPLALSPSEITAKGFLQDPRVMIVLSLAHLFQQEQLFVVVRKDSHRYTSESVSKRIYRFGCFNKDFGFAQLKFRRIHVDGVHDDFDAFPWIPSPFRPCFFGNQRVPEKKRTVWINLIETRNAIALILCCLHSTFNGTRNPLQVVTKQ